MAMQAFVVRTGAESEWFATAFYKFLELRGRTLLELNSACTITTEPGIGHETKRVTLWSRNAVSEFERFWEHYKVTARSSNERLRRVREWC